MKIVLNKCVQLMRGFFVLIVYLYCTFLIMLKNIYWHGG